MDEQTTLVGLSILIALVIIGLAIYVFEVIKDDLKEHKKYIAELDARDAIVQAHNEAVNRREAERARLGLPSQIKYFTE